MQGLESRLHTCRGPARPRCRRREEIQKGLASIEAVSQQSSQTSVTAQSESEAILDHTRSLADVATLIGEGSQSLKKDAELLSKRFESFKL